MRPLVALLLLVGCTPAPEAPQELSELTRYLLREFDDEDPRTLQSGLENLQAILAELDLEGPRSERSFLPDHLQADDLVDLPRPDVPLDGCVPVAVAGRSEHSPDLFGRYTQVVDQSPAEPTASSYARTFVEPQDHACFAEASCERLITANQVRRTNAVYTVDYVLLKDFQWVPMTADGEETGERALLSRAWMDESAVGVNGQNTIVQSFTLDAFLPVDGGTWRYHALYSEADLAVEVDDEITAGTIRLSIDQHFDAHDAAISDEFGG